MTSSEVVRLRSSSSTSDASRLKWASTYMPSMNLLIGYASRPQSPYLALTKAPAAVVHERADSLYRRLHLALVRLWRQYEYNLVVP